MAVSKLEQQKPILEVKNLKKYFQVKDAFGRTKGQVKAVNNVSFDLYQGETFGLVGESGCGKSTTGRSILKLIEPTDGEVIFNNQDILNLSNNQLRKMRSDMQMVFQDPNSSLNPKKTIGSTLEETLLIHNIGSNKKERTDMVIDILKKVGLNEDRYYHYPHEFSGGQRQRIGLARALIVKPKVIICDESVSALDVSVQSQILNLLKKLQKEYKVTYLFISHDISVVRHISDRVGVMYLGQMVEEGPEDQLFSSPKHPYTKALLSSVPVPNPNIKKERIILQGEIPSPLNPPAGCNFHTRCPYAEDICKTKVPVRTEVGPRHYATCHMVV
jgi:peptide/nickel transport system ATP-binding protein/oligopeptide transport system ATP-binding protein